MIGNKPAMPRLLRSPLFWFILTVLAAILLSALGPLEKTLGANVRIVYLHGAWAITAEAVFGLSALAGTGRHHAGFRGPGNHHHHGCPRRRDRAEQCLSVQRVRHLRPDGDGADRGEPGDRTGGAEEMADHRFR